MGNEIAYILFVFSLLLVWIFYVWLYRPYRIDRTRQELFFIRNELFDYAADGNIDFYHPGYCQLRELLNSMIRFTHKVELVSLSCLMIALKKSPPQHSRFQNMVSDIEKLPKEVREELKTYIHKANMIMVSHLIKSSIILMVVALAFRISFALVKGWSNSWNYVKEKFPYMKLIDAMAMELA